MTKFPFLKLATTFCLILPTVISQAKAQDNGFLIHSARVFDGFNMRVGDSVLIVDGQIAKIASKQSFADSNYQSVDLGDTTLLPGFIELHAHLTYQNVPPNVVLKHGITTLRDVGGPLHAPYGGDGNLRILTSGPIITAPGGYPISTMGEKNIAIPVSDEDEARDAVQKLVEGGAVTIKIALEPGGEVGAPWSVAHGHGHGHGHEQSHHHVSTSGTWPLMSENTVKSIVVEAHKLGKRVTAHVAEQKGVEIALNAGVDEWAHTPCQALPDTLIEQAVAKNVKIVSTIDTLSKCPGVMQNAKRLAELGAEFLYGSEIAHPDIPWGINAQELMYLKHLTNMSPINLFRTATSRAGEYLNIPLLGTLLPGAPADLIAVKGDPTENFKTLEYPSLVISGGKIVFDDFGIGQIPARNLDSIGFNF